MWLVLFLSSSLSTMGEGLQGHQAFNAPPRVSDLGHASTVKTSQGLQRGDTKLTSWTQRVGSVAETWVQFPAPTYVRQLTMGCDPSSRGSDSSSGFRRNLACTWCIDIHAQKTVIHIK